MDQISLFRRPPQIIKFEKVIKEYGMYDIEIARIYSENGQLIREYRSSGYPIDPTIQIPESDRPVITNQILTHNHGSDTAFSKKDLSFAAKFQLAEIRVVGKSCLFSMVPKNSGWPNPDDLERRYDEINENPRFNTQINDIKYSPQFLAKSKDPDADIYKVRARLICELLAKEFNLDFRESKWS